jgi:hypothetical protein
MAHPDGGYGKDPAISEALGITIAALLAVALYNVIELNVLIFTTFKRIRTLYPWSLLISTWGIAIWSLGFLLKSYRITRGTVLYSTMIALGWCAMVTGQSLVLYSRLHFVLSNRTAMRAILGMIIFNAIFMHIPTIIMGFGANSDHPKVWLKLYPIYEKVNVTVFFLQELIISVTYVVCTARWLKGDVAILRKQTRMLRILALVNFLVVSLDIGILALEYAGLYDLQTAYKGMAYSIKLKLEFRVLNDLVKFATTRLDVTDIRAGTNDRSQAERRETPDTVLTPYSTAGKTWSATDPGAQAWTQHTKSENTQKTYASMSAMPSRPMKSRSGESATSSRIELKSREEWLP